MQKIVSTGSGRDPALSLRAPQDDTLSQLSFFETSPTLAVAVSGGADSMALLLLANGWARERNGKVVALTVDHGLRAEAAAEAAQVKQWCKERAIEHYSLPLEGGGLGWGSNSNSHQEKDPLLNPPPFRGRKPTQADAREARYTLLTDWCNTHHILHLLTAHHQGDQAETLCFRLARGSGLDGLASIPSVSVRNGVRLLRPLLAFPKSSLQQYLHTQDQGWLEDPTNATPKYTRNVIRAALSEADNQAAASLAERLAVIRNHMEHRLAEHMVRAVSLFPSGQAVLCARYFSAMPPVYATKLLAALVQTIGGNGLPPRTEKLTHLYNSLRDSKNGTLGGCLFRYQPGRQSFLVSREHISPLPERFQPAKPLAGSAFLGLNSA